MTRKAAPMYSILSPRGVDVGIEVEHNPGREPQNGDPQFIVATCGACGRWLWEQSAPVPFPGIVLRNAENEKDIAAAASAHSCPDPTVPARMAAANALLDGWGR